MDISDFIATVTTAPSADNSQPWGFYADGSDLVAHYRQRSSGCDPFGPFGHATLLSGGALHENICAVLTDERAKADLATPSGTAMSWTIRMPLEAIEHADPNTSRASIRNRHTNRHPFSRLPHENYKSTLATTRCRIVAVTAADEIAALGRCLQRCSEGRFNDPELHEWLYSSIRWSEKEAESGTGLDIGTLHLPPGGRQFMRWISPWERMKLLNRFGIYKILAHADSALFRQAPAIIAYIGGADAGNIWDAGRALHRTWVALNQAGIAVHPYYAITDLGNRLRSGRLPNDWASPISMAQDQARALLNLHPGEQIHMLFRIGVATAIPLRSRRLPASSFVEGLPLHQ